MSGHEHHCVLCTAACMVQGGSAGFTGKSQLLKQQKLGRNWSDLCANDSVGNFLSLHVTCMGIAAGYGCGQLS